MANPSKDGDAKLEGLKWQPVSESALFLYPKSVKSWEKQKKTQKNMKLWTRKEDVCLYGLKSSNF